MKWGLVIAGISDFYRPPEKLSLTQNLALTATGSIWTRWCLIIKPKNYLYVPKLNRSYIKLGPFSSKYLYVFLAVRSLDCFS
jgi:hypothetical protein